MINLAGVSKVIADEQCSKELKESRIRIIDFRWLESGEVDTSIYGDLGPSGWYFTRAWYYWVAKGPGIPPKEAEEFHKLYGKVVRVEGHCNCPSPLEYNKGFGTGLYHIDTQEGLNAFAELIRSICTADVLE